jgi:hypothetical protein
VIAVLGLVGRIYLFVLTMPFRHLRDLGAVPWQIWIPAAVPPIAIIGGAILVMIAIASSS